MKKKLQLLILMILCSVSFVQAQKIDVWDFGGATLDPSLYNNNLTAAIINGWYASTVSVGTTGNTLPNSSVLPLTAGVLTLKTGNSDRLYTNNTTITRYATGNLGTTDPNYSARYYCNGSASSTTRFFTLTLNADDEVTVVSSIETTIANLTVVNTTTNTQTELIPLVVSGTGVTQAKFQAKQAGDFKISSLAGKGNYYRILRKAATYVNLSGYVNETAAPGINGYSVVFTNSAGKSWIAPVSGGAYNVSLPGGYTYKMAFLNASGYIISNGNTLDVPTMPATMTYGITALKVDTFPVNGMITGLGTNINKLVLTYTPDPLANKTYVPVPVITASNSTYTVELEANVQYAISAQGVNDYSIPMNIITITGSTTTDVAFALKPVYPVTINTTGLDATQLSNLKLTFTNLNESGYVYNFASTTGIALRDGTYAITYTGLDAYPVDLGLVSNITVNGAGITKTLAFKPVTVWSFDDRTITTATSTYKGILFGGSAGTITNNITSGHLLARTGGTVQVPVKVGDKITVSYCFAANFSIDGGAAITTTSGSTTNVEKVEYTYPGTTNGFVTITMGGTSYTTYLTEVSIGGFVPYSPTITVGTNKTYTTINDALTAISKMNRTATDRVTVLIDPGNYEEMLVVTQENVTLKNASTNPNINLLNKGVDIDAEAVRITSYYGHGYSYYSMGADQKWHADVLQVNKENGCLSYVNTGSGTTNGSYWNTTVAINANGFTAEDIIFENSFNQYISKKESEDIVVLWAIGNKGVRPTTIGNTDVQKKNFIERGAAIAIFNSIDKVVLNKCRIVGRQDSFYGGTGARVAVYKGVIMGGTDYIFGGMNAVFYKSELAMNTSEDSNDLSYITAAQQAIGRGFLMYECKITSAVPMTETASSYRSKPGYFGRPWAANTSEAVFYNTTIQTSDNPSFSGQSLILPLGWLDTLSGQSSKMYEYGTIENSGIDNQANRAAWATKLTTATLSDGTVISPFNFTKGSDNWDPIVLDVTLNSSNHHEAISAVTVSGYKNTIAIANVKSNAKVLVYNLNGALVKSVTTDTATNIEMTAGIWIVVVKATDGQKVFKLMTY